MEDILERPRHARNSNNVHPPLRDITSPRILDIPSPTSSISSHTYNTYVNLQPPPKPSFNFSANLQFFTEEFQNTAPPKPSVPKSEQLDSLIYSTLKEIQPSVKYLKSPPPPPSPLTVGIPRTYEIPNKKFTVTPVESEGCPTPTTYVDGISTNSSNSELESKLSTPPEPVKFITVPEDLANLDRKSILRARLRKSIQYAKRALGFIISHVGLSLLVIGYTILGAAVFCSVEKEKERQIKIEMANRFNSTVVQLMDLWVKSYFNLSSAIDVIRRAVLMNRTLEIHAQGKQGLEGLDWYLKGLELSQEVIPKHWLDGIMNENSTESGGSLSSFTDSKSSIFTSPMTTLTSTTAAASTTTPLPPLDLTTLLPVMNLTSNFPYNDLIMMAFNGSTNASEVPKIKILAETFKDNVTKIIATYVNQVVHAIKDEGWNGATNTDDINWTFEGGVLFAITVFTTIGKLTVVIFTLFHQYERTCFRNLDSLFTGLLLK
nr:hypothetical transcript [Hymenolepis microstoma]